MHFAPDDFVVLAVFCIIVAYIGGTTSCTVPYGRQVLLGSVLWGRMARQAVVASFSRGDIEKRYHNNSKLIKRKLRRRAGARMALKLDVALGMACISFLTGYIQYPTSMYLQIIVALACIHSCVLSATSAVLNREFVYFAHDDKIDI